MLTLTNPAVLTVLRSVRCGLFPFEKSDGEGLCLTIKCSKEAILAAKVRNGFRFYLLPIRTDYLTTHGLVTAFLDDDDEPLVIRSPLLDDDFSSGILELLSREEFEVYFFDEHTRELLGYRAGNCDAGRFRKLRHEIGLASPDDYPRDHHLAGQIDDKISGWFGNRNAKDDAAALVINFKEALFDDRFYILDARPEVNSYHGRRR